MTLLQQDVEQAPSLPPCTRTPMCSLSFMPRFSVPSLWSDLNMASSFVTKKCFIKRLFSSTTLRGTTSLGSTSPSLYWDFPGSQPQHGSRDKAFLWLQPLTNNVSKMKHFFLFKTLDYTNLFTARHDHSLLQDSVVPKVSFHIIPLHTKPLSPCRSPQAHF